MAGSDGGDGFGGDSLGGADRPNVLKLPDVDGQAAGIVENRIQIGQLNPQRGRQVVLLDLGFGLFERPWNVMDAGAHRLPGVVVGKQAIALGQKIFE
jgi:hypothetical protein